MTDHDLPAADDPNRCPRCAGWIPNSQQRGAYPGALSRLDNRTYICSQCGQAEAMRDFHRLPPIPPDEWPIPLYAES
jgi:hypothetical protein